MLSSSTQRSAMRGTRAVGDPILTADERLTVTGVLGPEEKPLRVLRGLDARGAVLWIATNRRLIVVECERAELHPVFDMAHHSINSVMVRGGEHGASLLRVRSTGRQVLLAGADTEAAEAFAVLLRDKAGLAPAPRQAQEKQPLPSAQRSAPDRLTVGSLNVAAAPR